jgi:hypothetical protein
MAKSPPLTERILKDGDEVAFVAITPKYGRAEFRFCLHYLRGKLDEVFIYPMQQPAAKEWFRLPQCKQGTFSANSWTHQGMDEPYVWRHFWCKEHKAAAFDLYVPRQAIRFEVHGNDIYFASKEH